MVAGANDNRPPVPVVEITAGPRRRGGSPGGASASGIGCGWTLALDPAAGVREGCLVAVQVAPGSVGAYWVRDRLLVPEVGPGAILTLDSAEVLGVARQAWRDL